MVVVASQNPVKINSIKKGFGLVFKEKIFEYKSVAVSSDVSDQPMTVAETYLGALNRIKNAKNIIADARFYCGIEGGLEYFEGQYYAFAWVVISDGNKTGKARTASFLLPPAVIKLIRQGMELGTADDIVFGHQNSKQKQGSVGIMTNNIIDRTEYYAHAVILALIPFIKEELF